MNRIKPDWKMPNTPNRKCDCGLILDVPIAIDEGEWVLAWECDNECGDCEIMNIETWPFVDNYANGDDMKRAGFQVR